MRVRSRGLASSAQEIHLHHRGRRPCDERGVRRRRDLRHVGQELRILRAVVQIIVADQQAVRLAAELACTPPHRPS